MKYVSLVLISHSYEIVSGLKKLLSQVQPDVPIAIAGGAEGGIGTNAFDIQTAIESVYSEKGVVVLFDLGSALINAEMALEMLEPHENIRIADAPLVEGAYAAVVAAGLGSSLAEVVRASESAKELVKIHR
ncbi:dihydroxyacetone kinase, phosphotransfer subunit [Anoxybacillus sp. B7M1]|uniref:dihydroxyacetone kinase phosphoryl donor subunit DhaM n=1 Tax=unclassified Anoxybacillus TaxID=2639704 RepID=UPI0005CDCBF3|nr:MULTISPECIES: dihydroxyacetone kinase phosphoryl donor subunit DhaM [unclassified Anoxybacillus]ANB56226.1 dihydroxyacetone kinase, phosphotransfer subunit [Anoxybacillus sp. B2M1]ANB64458.1 dihydroxyacetone kinase, phosphotransfer subunit [Anoxybacillus sp. B7M1]